VPRITKQIRQCRNCGCDFLPHNNRQFFCNADCRKRYRLIPLKKGGRFSGRIYTNTLEKLAKIKEKYKNGVTTDILKEFAEKIQIEGI
jgi:hypothetical protein